MKATSLRNTFLVLNEILRRSRRYEDSWRLLVSPTRLIPNISLATSLRSLPHHTHVLSGRVMLFSRHALLSSCSSLVVLFSRCALLSLCSSLVVLFSRCALLSLCSSIVVLLYRRALLLSPTGTNLCICVAGTISPDVVGPRLLRGLCTYCLSSAALL